MNAPDNEIVFTGSRNLDDDSGNNEMKEEDRALLRELLEDQGIVILEEKRSPEKTNPHDEVSRELMDQGGIEILHIEESEDPLY